MRLIAFYVAFASVLIYSAPSTNNSRDHSASAMKYSEPASNSFNNER